MASTDEPTERVCLQALLSVWMLSLWCRRPRPRVTVSQESERLISGSPSFASSTSVSMLEKQSTGAPAEYRLYYSRFLALAVVVILELASNMVWTASLLPACMHDGVRLNV